LANAQTTNDTLCPYDDATVLRCNRRASTIDAFAAAINNDVLDEAIVVTACRQSMHGVMEHGAWLGNEFLPAKWKRRFLLPISSRQMEESMSIADFFPPNREQSTHNNNAINETAFTVPSKQ
jgi:hypothetical protein